MKLFKIVLLIISLNTHSQNKDFTIKIQYAETVSYNTSIINNYESTLYTDGEYAIYKKNYKNTETKSNVLEGEGEIIMKSVENKFLQEIYTNSKGQELVENFYESKFLKKTFSVFEELPKMQWQFLKETMKIKNFICKQAKTTFRGRTYFAWYYEKIATKSGPWKFNGLPGLIMSVEDISGIYKWKIKSINYPYKDVNFDIKKTYQNRIDYTKITFKDFDSKLVKMIKEKINIVKARNSIRTTYKVGFEYSTFQEQEPINEFRKQMIFK